MSVRSRVLVFFISTPLAAFLVVGGLLGAARRPVTQSAVPHLRVFEDVVSLIVKDYVEDVNVDRVFDGAMRGLSDGLDGSSAYLTPEEVKAIDAKPTPPPADIGIVLTRQFYLRVVGVRDGSPAKRAGIQAGDLVRAIDDSPTRDLSALAGAKLLRGAPGSKVTLLIVRTNPAEPSKVDLVREVPKDEPITTRRLAGGELYVRVPAFGAGTAAALRDAITTAKSGTGAGANHVVLDIRDVAEGTAEDGIAAARLFVKGGTLATLAARGAANVVTKSNDSDGALAMPVAVLVSNGTGNAAEVFAAALAGNTRARLVGEPTAGLAGLQRLVRLPEGHGLWLTYARYLQSDGAPIHERGLRPNVIVETPLIAFGEPQPAGDSTLDRAIEDLKRAAEPAAPAAVRPSARGTNEAPENQTRQQQQMPQLKPAPEKSPADLRRELERQRQQAPAPSQQPRR